MNIFVAPLLEAPMSSVAPVHWTAWTPGFYNNEHFVYTYYNLLSPLQGVIKTENQ